MTDAKKAAAEGKKRMSKKWRVFWIAAALLVAGAIFCLSAQPSVRSEDLSDAVAGVLRLKQKSKSVRVSNQDLFLGLTVRKLGHIVMYAALAFCICNAVTGIRGKIPLSAGISYAYAVLDEVHQNYSGRNGRWQDTLIDLVGIVIGIAAAVLLAFVREKIANRKTADGKTG